MGIVAFQTSIIPISLQKVAKYFVKILFNFLVAGETKISAFLFHCPKRSMTAAALIGSKGLVGKFSHQTFVVGRMGIMTTQTISTFKTKIVVEFYQFLILCRMAADAYLFTVFNQQKLIISGMGIVAFHTITRLKG